jgi:hypothetical protein
VNGFGTSVRLKRANGATVRSWLLGRCFRAISAAARGGSGAPTESTSVALSQRSTACAEQRCRISGLDRRLRICVRQRLVSSTNASTPLNEMSRKSIDADSETSSNDRSL